MSKAWMVRAGEGGEVVDDFARGFVAIGWHELGDLTGATTREKIRELYDRAFPNDKPGKSAGAVAMLFKFRVVMQPGDKVVSYDPRSREYLVGTIAGDYYYDPTNPEYPQRRKATWAGRVGRDQLPVSSRKSLNPAQAVFSLNDEVWGSIATVLGGERARPEQPDAEEEKAELDESREETIATAHELIKDQVIRLDDSELEQLTAALLRAMGYRTRITAKGPDRGVDISASPDGLGFQEPRIKVEVKHRPKTTMGAPEVRSFIAALQAGDRGLYVSSGGFTKEAGYEAERSKIPVTLLDLDDLVISVVTYYESFDIEGRALLPLVRVYWPVPS